MEAGLAKVRKGRNPDYAGFVKAVTRHADKVDELVVTISDYFEQSQARITRDFARLEQVSEIAVSPDGAEERRRATRRGSGGVRRRLDSPAGWWRG